MRRPSTCLYPLQNPAQTATKCKSALASGRVDSQRAVAPLPAGRTGLLLVTSCAVRMHAGAHRERSCHCEGDQLLVAAQVVAGLLPFRKEKSTLFLF